MRRPAGAPGSRPRRGHARVRMLETIREYGREQLEASPDAADAGRRHAAYFLALAQPAAPELTGPDAGTWLARLDTEHDNLRAALRWAQGQATGSCRFAWPARSGRYWERRGHLSEGRQWFAQTLTRDPADPADAERSVLPMPLTRSGWLLGAAGRLATGQAAYDEAAPASPRRSSWPASRARTPSWPRRSTSGPAGPGPDRMPTRPTSRRGAEAGPGGGQPRRGGLGPARHGLRGHVHRRHGRVVPLAEESLAAARVSPDRLILARVLFFLSFAASNAGASRAEALATESLGLFAALGEPASTPRPCSCWGPWRCTRVTTPGRGSSGARPGRAA